MTVQAFFDDSGNEPTSPIFVLAGFITTNQRWAAFSDEWQLALEEPPRLEYFKMAEAEHFRGQFSKRKGWTNENRDARLITLANIVAKYAIVRVHASILHSSFHQWIKSIRNPTRNSAQDNPYFALFQLIVQIVSALRVRAFNNDPCEIVFDEQGSMGADAIYFWEKFRRNPAATASETADLFHGYFDNPPIFRDEKKCLPLQASDLYAWQLRRRFVETDGLPRSPLLALEKIESLGFDLSDEAVRNISQSLVEIREQFIENRPGIQLFGPGEGPKRGPFSKRIRK
jgi:hypothetical protein